LACHAAAGLAASVALVEPALVDQEGVLEVVQVEEAQEDLHHPTRRGGCLWTT